MNRAFQELCRDESMNGPECTRAFHGIALIALAELVTLPGTGIRVYDHRKRVKLEFECRKGENARVRLSVR